MTQLIGMPTSCLFKRSALAWMTLLIGSVGGACSSGGTQDTGNTVDPTATGGRAMGSITAYGGQTATYSTGGYAALTSGGTTSSTGATGATGAVTGTGVTACVG